MQHSKKILTAIVLSITGATALLCSTLAQAQEVRTYFITDAVGSPVKATDAYANVTWSEDYLPYGERRSQEISAGDNDRWFTGAPQNEHTGLVDLGNRQYDPVIGRFLSIDPVGASPGQPFSINRYAYANNNPYGYVDPHGRNVFSVLDWKDFAVDVGSLLVDEIVYGAAVVNGDSAVQQLALDGMVEGRVAAAASTAGVISPAPGTGRAIKSAERGMEMVGEVSKKFGRTGDQKRLRELVNDDKASSADRGWIQQELNSIQRGQRSRIRRPPGKELAHERGREAAKGYDYEHSNLQDKDLHDLQHKYDDFGRANRERPVE